MNGIMVLVVYAVLMIVATIVFAKRDKDSDSFYVGNRNMGTIQKWFIGVKDLLDDGKVNGSQENQNN